MAEKINEMGLTVNGLVMAKNTFPSEKGDRFSIDIAVPGLRSMLSLGVTEAIYNSVEIMNPFKGSFNFSLYKERVYFNHVDPTKLGS